MADPRTERTAQPTPSIPTNAKFSSAADCGIRLAVQALHCWKPVRLELYVDSADRSPSLNAIYSGQNAAFGWGLRACSILACGSGCWPGLWRGLVRMFVGAGCRRANIPVAQSC